MEDATLIIQPDPPQGPVLLLDVGYERYTEGGRELAKVVLYTRNSGVRQRYVVKNYFPYFYVDTGEDVLEELLGKYPWFRSWYRSMEIVDRRIYEGGVQRPLIKLYGHQPWKVPSVRGIFETEGIPYFEADIPFTHRFMIDFRLKGLELIDLRSMTIMKSDYEPVVCSFDIEVDSDEYGSFGELISRADRRITAIGLAWVNGKDHGSKVFALKDDEERSEKEMISNALGFMWRTIDPDILCTYNGDSFDMPYIWQRIKNLGIDPLSFSPHHDSKLSPPAFGNGWQSAGLLIYDLYRKTKWLYTSDGRRTLDSVAQELLGEEKLTISISHSRLWRDFMDNPLPDHRFIEYTARDAELTVKLWDAMDMSQWLEVIKICGGPPSDAMYFTERQAGEFLVFQTMYQHGILIPSAPTAREKEVRKRERKSAMGGFVFDPIRDLANSVLICDFASMYPTIIVAHNIGGESFDHHEKELRDRFRPDPPTSMKIMQEELLTKRFEVKRELLKPADDAERKKLRAYSWALKIMANSTFGAYNFIGSRFYDTKLAGTITGIGRDYLRTIAARVEDFNPSFKTIYGDTDSVFIETDLDEEVAALYEMDDVRDVNEHIPEIHELLEFLHTFLPEQMVLELEDVAYRILFHKGAKKRYAYVSALTKDVSIMGFEAIRNDFSPFAKEVQEFAFEVLLRTGDLKVSKQRTIGHIRKLLGQEPESIKELVTTFGPIKRKPGDYKSVTPAVASYLHYKSKYPESESWKEIDFFPFIITRGSSSQKNRARHPELVDHSEIDIDHYIEEAIRSINRFNLNITLDEAKGISYGDLESYFDTRTV